MIRPANPQDLPAIAAIYEAILAGKRVIRLDTYVNNQPANSMYPRLGYRFAGTSHFLFQGFLPEDLNCYEELL